MMGWLLGLVFISLAFFVFLLRLTTTTTVRKKIERNRKIADLSSHSLTDRLKLRAGPNVRLAKAFAITNSFTTSDEHIHREFHKRAVKVINDAGAGRWLQVQRLAKDTLVSLCSIQGKVGEINIEPICRVMCFVVALELLFPSTRKSTDDYERVDRITKAINDLWLQSKSKAPRDDSLLSKLRWDILELLPEEQDDPLALILPAYETLWRVVLLTYVHVGFRHLDSDTKVMLQGLLDKFHHLEQVEFDDNMHRLSQEALRLYPPTKRIYRTSWFGTVAADVESLHHDEDIWGPDAREFRPARFSALTENQNDAFMPFGIGRHACPARNSFAGKMIAILVLTLSKQLGTAATGAKIKYQNKQLDNDGNLMVPLPTGRSAMKDWVLYPKPEA